MNAIYRIKSFLKFICIAKPLAGYGIHSPFVFNFTTNVLRKANKKNIPLPEIDNLIKRLKSDSRLLNVVDYGASSSGNIRKRKVSAIVHKASTRPSYCRILFKIAVETRPATIIELGTSLGISTVALSLAVSSATIYTIEGSEEIAMVAEENFKHLGLNNVKQYIGTFDEQIEIVLKEIQHPVLIYIDGNHNYEPTMKYFKIFAEKVNRESLIIIDDIHWSDQMSKAWNEICNFPGTTIKLDLYQMGIVFFKEGLPKLVYNIFL